MDVEFAVEDPAGGFDADGASASTNCDLLLERGLEHVGSVDAVWSCGHNEHSSVGVGD